jgi:hypothetical protein
MLVEYCRDCRDELPYGAEIPVASFIIWGKLFPPEALGPKCYEHTLRWVEVGQLDQIYQHAVYDLRPVYEMLSAGDPWR